MVAPKAKLKGSKAAPGPSAKSKNRAGSIAAYNTLKNNVAKGKAVVAQQGAKAPAARATAVPKKDSTAGALGKGLAALGRTGLIKR